MAEHRFAPSRWLRAGNARCARAPCGLSPLSTCPRAIAPPPGGGHDRLVHLVRGGVILSQSDDFFVPLHVAQLHAWCPEVLSFLGLAPGWRFLKAGDYALMYGSGVWSAFGGVIPTPPVDRIAKMCLRYRQFHSTTPCSPTRAALITGRNHHSVGFGKPERSRPEARHWQEQRRAMKERSIRRQPTLYRPA